MPKRDLNRHFAVLAEDGAGAAVVVFLESGKAGASTPSSISSLKKNGMLVMGGGMRVDYLITHDGVAHTGLIGGNAVYASVGAALWQEPVALWGRVAENYPQAWLSRLVDHGIQIRSLKSVPGNHDHRTFYAYTPDGRRDDTQPHKHFERIGRPMPQELIGYVHSTPGQDDPDCYEPLALRPGDWPELIPEVCGVHLAPLSLRTHLHVPSYLRQKGVSWITIDPGERYMIPELLPHVRQVLSQVDVFLPSLPEVQSLFGKEVNIEEAARMLAGWGPEVIVVKCGADGIIVYEKNLDRSTRIRPFHEPGDERIVDVTGAGDSFCGGFLVGLATTGNSLQAAKQGLVSASLVIEGYGATYALGQPREIARERLAQMST